MSLVVVPAAVQTTSAQGNVPIHTDQLVSGFEDWGWATLNYANSSPVHSGASSISVTASAPWQGIQLYHANLDDSLYSSVSF